MKTKKIEIEIPTLELSNIRAFVKELKAYNRDWNIHYISHYYHVWVMTEKDANKLKKANAYVREKMLDKLLRTVLQYPLIETSKIYQSYPDEYTLIYKIYIPKEILKVMKEKALVLVVFEIYNAYDEYSIDIHVYTPKEIETWDCVEISVDQLPQI